jgi:hypothetical protein
VGAAAALTGYGERQHLPLPEALVAGGGLRRPDRAAAGEATSCSAPSSVPNSCFSQPPGSPLCLFPALPQLDFDGGAPPEQAWRRRLNSHANLLKEFSVTFMEAMRMVRIACLLTYLPARLLLLLLSVRRCFLLLTSEIHSR